MAASDDLFEQLRARRARGRQDLAHQADSPIVDAELVRRGYNDAGHGSVDYADNHLSGTMPPDDYEQPHNLVEGTPFAGVAGAGITAITGIILGSNGNVVPIEPIGFGDNIQTRTLRHHENVMGRETSDIDLSSQHRAKVGSQHRDIDRGTGDYDPDLPIKDFPKDVHPIGGSAIGSLLGGPGILPDSGMDKRLTGSIALTTSPTFLADVRPGGPFGKRTLAALTLAPFKPSFRRPEMFGIETVLLNSVELEVGGSPKSGCPKWTIRIDLRKDPNAGKLPSDDTFDQVLEDYADQQMALMKKGDTLENHVGEWKAFGGEDNEETFYVKVIGAARKPAPVCEVVISLKLVGVESEVVFWAGEPMNWHGSGKPKGAVDSILDSLRPKAAECEELSRQRLKLVNRQGRGDDEFYEDALREASELGPNAVVEWDPSQPNRIEIWQLDCFGNCEAQGSKCRARSYKGSVNSKPYSVAWCGCHDHPSQEGLRNIGVVTTIWMGQPEDGDEGDLSDLEREKLYANSADCTFVLERAMRTLQSQDHALPSRNVVRPAVYRRQPKKGSEGGAWETDSEFVKRVQADMISNIACAEGYTPVVFLHPNDPLHIYIDCVKCEGSCGSTDCKLRTYEAVNTYIHNCIC